MVAMNRRANLVGKVRKFSPLQVPGLMAWYDASNTASITYGINPSIAQWNDISGNKRHLTQGTAAAQPTLVAAFQNGLPAVQFVNTSSQYFGMAAPIPVTKGYSVCGVFKRKLTGVVEVGGQSAFGTAYAMEVFTDGSVFSYSSIAGNSNFETGIVVDTANAHAIQSVVTNGGSVSGIIMIDGTFATQVANADGSASFTQIDRIGLGDTNTFCNAYFMELLIFNRALGRGEMRLLQPYFKAKWATP